MWPDLWKGALFSNYTYLTIHNLTCEHGSTAYKLVTVYSNITAKFLDAILRQWVKYISSYDS